MRERIYSEIWVNAFLKALERKGVLLKDICDDAQVIEHLSRSRQNLFNYDQLQIVSNLLLDKFGGFNIVLETDSLPEPGSYKFIDHLSVFCADLEVGIRKFYDNLNLIVPFELIYNLTDWGDVIAFEMKCKGPETEFFRHMSPLDICVFVQRAKHWLGENFLPKDVSMQISRPDDPNIFARYFTCPVQYDKPYSRVLFDSKYYKQSLMNSEPLLARFIEDNIFELFRKIQFKEQLVSQVERIVRTGLFNNKCDLEFVAKQLGMSKRVLQQKLNALGTSFSEILKEVRLNYSIRYIKEKRGPISKLSEDLGFTEPVSFYRAFKRWTGKTLKEYFKN